MNKLLIAAIATIGFSTAALAQGDGEIPEGDDDIEIEVVEQDTDFASVDADGSGDVSFEEALVAWPDLTPEEFKAFDLDDSGTLSEEEYDTLVLDMSASYL